MTFYHDRTILKKSQYEGLKAAIRLYPIGLITASAYAVLVFLIFGMHFEDKLMLAGVIGTFATALVGLPVTFIDLRRGCPETRFLHARYIALNAVLSLFVSIYLWTTVRDSQGHMLIFAGVMMFGFWLPARWHCPPIRLRR